MHRLRFFKQKKKSGCGKETDDLIGLVSVCYFTLIGLAWPRPLIPKSLYSTYKFLSAVQLSQHLLTSQVMYETNRITGMSVCTVTTLLYHSYSHNTCNWSTPLATPTHPKVMRLPSPDTTRRTTPPHYIPKYQLILLPHPTNTFPGFFFFYNKLIQAKSYTFVPLYILLQQILFNISSFPPPALFSRDFLPHPLLHSLRSEVFRFTYICLHCCCS